MIPKKVPYPAERKQKKTKKTKKTIKEWKRKGRKKIHTDRNTGPHAPMAHLQILIAIPSQMEPTICRLLIRFAGIPEE